MQPLSPPQPERSFQNPTLPLLRTCCGSLVFLGEKPREAPRSCRPAGAAWPDHPPFWTPQRSSCQTLAPGSAFPVSSQAGSSGGPPARCACTSPPSPTTDRSKGLWGPERRERSRGRLLCSSDVPDLFGGSASKRPLHPKALLPSRVHCPHPSPATVPCSLDRALPPAWLPAQGLRLHQSSPAPTLLRTLHGSHLP